MKDNGRRSARWREDSTKRLAMMFPASLKVMRIPVLAMTWCRCYWNLSTNVNSGSGGRMIEDGRKDGVWCLNMTRESACKSINCF